MKTHELEEFVGLLMRNSGRWHAATEDSWTISLTGNKQRLISVMIRDKHGIFELYVESEKVSLLTAKIYDDVQMFGQTLRNKLWLPTTDQIIQDILDYEKTVGVGYNEQ